MVRDDGYVKVLDFGLARLLPAPSLAEAATDGKRAGALLGTLHYMSPEQASGKTSAAARNLLARPRVL